jgi:hypothetical protein
MNQNEFFIYHPDRTTRLIYADYLESRGDLFLASVLREENSVPITYEFKGEGSGYGNGYGNGLGDLGGVYLYNSLISWGCGVSSGDGDGNGGGFGCGDGDGFGGGNNGLGSGWGWGEGEGEGSGDGDGDVI